MAIFQQRAGESSTQLEQRFLRTCTPTDLSGPVELMEESGALWAVVIPHRGMDEPFYVILTTAWAGVRIYRVLNFQTEGEGNNYVVVDLRQYNPVISNEP